MDLQLRDKRAIVTGGSRGIGLAIARSLAAEGCRVAIAARVPEPGSRNRKCSLARCAKPTSDARASG